MGILKDIRKAVGGDPDDTTFDDALIIFINSAFATARQGGCGDFDVQFHITGDAEEWEDSTDDPKSLPLLKEFVFLDTKLVFDPPSNPTVLKHFQEKRNEDLWRLNHEDQLETT